MSTSSQLRFTLVVSIGVLGLFGGKVSTQADIVDPANNNLPNPFQTVIRNWGTLPEGRTWGIDGQHRYWP